MLLYRYRVPRSTTWRNRARGLGVHGVVEPGAHARRRPADRERDRGAVPQRAGTADQRRVRHVQPPRIGDVAAADLSRALEQVADHPLTLNQGTLYPALVRLEQKGWIKASWQTTDSNREAKYYAITRAGTRSAKAKPGRHIREP